MKTRVQELEEMIHDADDKILDTVNYFISNKDSAIAFMKLIDTRVRLAAEATKQM